MSSCWWSVSHAAGEWEKQRSKPPGQTNAEEWVGRGQAAVKEGGQARGRRTLRRIKNKAVRILRKGQRSAAQ